ncbi:hypothetical protein NDU88_008944 [Pleurodeles waltl]|uniref:Uncharacterized protein n=1 Tax=Pleurodeles waltl TaxID=8319 RepID=A0AAV7RXN7_PLEWA|nr:hypothetical protein NDU88_008944 [Pleurodeles waltl]
MKGLGVHWAGREVSPASSGAPRWEPASGASSSSPLGGKVTGTESRKPQEGFASRQRVLGGPDRKSVEAQLRALCLRASVGSENPGHRVSIPCRGEHRLLILRHSATKWPFRAWPFGHASCIPMARPDGWAALGWEPPSHSLSSSPLAGTLSLAQAAPWPGCLSPVETAGTHWCLCDRPVLPCKPQAV